MTWKIFSNGWSDVTGVVPRYHTTGFMFRGNYFVVTILSHNIAITWAGRKQITAAKAED